MKKKETRGGARDGAGRKSKPGAEKKVTVIFYIKQKHVETARAKIQPIVDRLNKT